MAKTVGQPPGPVRGVKRGCGRLAASGGGIKLKMRKLEKGGSKKYVAYFCGLCIIGQHE